MAKLDPAAALPPPHRQHFILLDATRGIAAIAVMLYHFEGQSDTRLVHLGYLAVDYFLLLSGFVVALSYEQKMSERMTFSGFLTLRVLRLWPMIVAAGLIATLAWKLDRGHVDRLTAVFQLALIPLLTSSRLFPYNIALWSLFLEILANILHYLLIRRCSLCGLVMILIGLVAINGSLLAATGTLNWGPSPRELVPAFSRIMMSYVAGVIFYRLYLAGRLPRVKLPGALGWLTPLLIVFIPLLAPSTMSRMVTILALACLFPLALVLGLNASPPYRQSHFKTFRWLGGISYPLYTIHLPMLRLWMASGWLAFSAPHHRLAWWTMALTTILVASAFERWFDAPIRAVIRRRTSHVGKQEINKVLRGV